MEELTEPEDWKFEPLKDIDRLLRCSICFEYFKTAMMMPNCPHNYCSLCIRKHLQLRQLCPMCSKPVSESQLRCNRLVDNLVSSFSSNRTSFMALLASGKNGMTLPAIKVGGAPTSPHRIPKPPSPGASILDLTDSELSQDLGVDLPAEAMECNATSFTQPPKGPSSHQGSVHHRKGELGFHHSCEAPPFSIPTVQTVTTVDVHSQTHATSHSKTVTTPTSRRQQTEMKAKRGGAVSTASKRRSDLPLAGSSGVEPLTAANTGGGVATPTSSSSVKVACPVCQVEVFERFINSHLDQCLKNQSMATPTGSHAPSHVSSPVVKRLPKLVFSVMNDKQLRKRLKEYHLSTNGKRDALLKRIKEFTLLYNSECDALHPRTMKEVAMEIESAEKGKSGSGHVASRKGSTPSSSALHSQPGGSRRSSESADKRDQYMKAHDDHFSKLIADVRSREATRRRSSTPSTSSDRGSPDMADGRVGGASVVKSRKKRRQSSSSPDQQDKSGRRTSSTGLSSEQAVSGLISDGDLDEESQIVFASDSPNYSPPISPLLLGQSSSRGVALTTSIPESPTADLKFTPSSRKRVSGRYKGGGGLSLSALYRDEDDNTSGDTDPDFLPATRSKKHRRH